MSDPPAARLGLVTTWAAILTVVLLAEVRSVVATRTDGFTIDEPYHIAAGVSYVRTGDLRLNPEHPPLVKLWAGAVLSPGFRLAPFRPLADKLDERNFTDIDPGNYRLHLKIGGRDHACAAAALFPHAHEAERGCR